MCYKLSRDRRGQHRVDRRKRKKCIRDKKLSDGNKKAIEEALDVLKKAKESKDVENIKTALEGINGAWKNASEELYKAQAETQQAGGSAGAQPDSPESPDSKDGSDDVQDVDFGL